MPDEPPAAVPGEPVQTLTTPGEQIETLLRLKSGTLTAGAERSLMLDTGGRRIVTDWWDGTEDLVCAWARRTLLREVQRLGLGAYR